MKVIIDGDDHSAAYTAQELTGIGVEQRAWDAEVGTGSAPVPDEADFEPYADQQFKLMVGATTVFDGFLGATARDRGEVVGGSRMVTTYSLRDENAILFGRRYIGNRPEETDQARVLAIASAVGLTLDTTWVLGTNLVTVPAKRYRVGDVFNELLNDLVAPTAKTMFVIDGELHWHRPTEGEAATVSLNDGAYDNVSVFSLLAATPRRSKDPHELFNDVMARNDDGTVIVSDSDATSIARHDAAGIKHQELILEDGTSGYLTALVAARLAEAKQERITYECDIGPLTAAQVLLFKPGSLIEVTSQVWGLSGSTKRIANRRVSYTHPDQFTVSLELGHPVRRRRPRAKEIKEKIKNEAGIGSDSGGGEVCCPPFLCTPNDFEVHSVDASDAACVIAAGGAIQCQSSSAPGATRTLYAGATYRIEHFVNHGPNSNHLSAFMYSTGGNQVGLIDMGSLRLGTNVPFASVDVTVGFTSEYFTWLQDAFYSGRDSADASVSTHAIYLSGPDPRFENLERCVEGAPSEGQPINHEAIPGAPPGTPMTTNYPYTPGSLQGTVQETGQHIVLDEIDATLATFSSPMDLTGLTLLLDYQASGEPASGATNPTASGSTLTVPPTSVLARWEPHVDYTGSVVLDGIGNPVMVEVHV